MTRWLSALPKLPKNFGRADFVDSRNRRKQVWRRQEVHRTSQSWRQLRHRRRLFRRPRHRRFKSAQNTSLRKTILKTFLLFAKESFTTAPKKVRKLKVRKKKPQKMFERKASRASFLKCNWKKSNKFRSPPKQKSHWPTSTAAIAWSAFRGPKDRSAKVTRTSRPKTPRRRSSTASYAARGSTPISTTETSSIW